MFHLPTAGYVCSIILSQKRRDQITRRTVCEPTAERNDWDLKASVTEAFEDHILEHDSTKKDRKTSVSVVDLIKSLEYSASWLTLGSYGAAAMVDDSEESKIQGEWKKDVQDRKISPRAESARCGGLFKLVTWIFAIVDPIELAECPESKQCGAIRRNRAVSAKSPPLLRRQYAPHVGQWIWLVMAVYIGSYTSNFDDLPVLRAQTMHSVLIGSPCALRLLVIVQ